MQRHSRAGARPVGWRTWALLLAALGLTVGCSPFTLLGLLFSAGHLEQPDCPLTIDGKESKVVIVAAHANLPSNPALIPADWELTYKLTQILEARYKENGDKVKIVSPMQVKGYMSKNPRWREATPQEIGKHFGADYVVNLEIESISLYEKGSANFFYKGSAVISVTVTEVAKPVGEGQKWECPYQIAYPTGGIQEINEMSPGTFRTKFIDRIAKDMAKFFAAHEPSEKYITSD
jgi:hypothetical protein